MSSCNYEAKGAAVSANSIKKGQNGCKGNQLAIYKHGPKDQPRSQGWVSPGNEVAEGFEPWTTGQTTLARTVKAGLGLSFSRHF